MNASKKEMLFRCPVCGLRVFSNEEGIDDFPLKRLDLCKKCRVYNILALSLGIIPLLFVLLTALAHECIFYGLSTRSLLTLIGISIDISGVCFLFGRLERPIVASGLLRGEGPDPVEVALPRHVWQTRLGLFLVIIGFLLQAYAQFA